MRELRETKLGKHIEYPFMPPEGEIIYEPADNTYLQIAKDFAREFSLDKTMPNTSVIVKDGEILSIGANGSNYHDEYGCERVRQNIPTGQGYELCEGCHPKNHGEQSAIMNAFSDGNGDRLEGAEVYLWGHWWCCESCWDAMRASGITTVHLLEESDVLFNRENSANIIGHQFEA